MFADYAALKAAIERWMDNDDGIALIDDFLMLCTIRMNRELKLPEATEYATFDTVVGEPWIPLPQMYSGMRRLKIVGSDPNNNQGYLGLTYKPLTYFDQTPALNAQGRPTSYTIAGQRIRLGPVPNAVFTIETAYYQKVPVLSASNTTSVFLEVASDMLLYGTLIEAAAYIRDPDRLQTYITGYSTALKNLTDDVEEERFPDGDMAVSAV